MAQAATIEPYRFTREQYERMVEAGVLEDLPVELLDGVIVEMTRQSPEHADMILVLTQLLARASSVRLCADGTR